MCQKVQGMCHQRHIDVPFWHIQYKTRQRQYKDKRFFFKKTKIGNMSSVSPSIFHWEKILVTRG